MSTQPAPSGHGDRTSVVYLYGMFRSLTKGFNLAVPNSVPPGKTRAQVKTITRHYVS